MGGAGKTQTAVEYAHLHRSEYTAVLWAKVDTEESLKTDYAAIAIELNLPEKDETDRDKVIAAVNRWLAAHSGWLLILDNADDLSLVSDLLKREWSGHILLTTRAYATGSVSKVEIPEMTVEEGTLFLLRRTKLIGISDALESATEADQALAAEVTQELGGLPLALDQAGAFIEEVPSSLTEYLELYRKEGDKLRAERGGVINADHEPVTITFSLAFQEVASVSATAADMLRVCAFLAPDTIPEEIFVNGAEELGENLAPMAGGGINLVKMIGEAGRFSLIHRNAKNGTIEIHRLVQQVLKDEMGAQVLSLWAERVVRALNRSFPEVEHKSWLLCEKLLPHAQEAARLIEEYGLEFEEAGRLLNQTGFYCYERAQYSEVEPLLVRALNIYEKVLEPENPGVAVVLNNMALLYDTRGRYAEAEPLYERALNINEKLLGPEHPAVATSLNNLALLYDNQGKYAQAEPLHKRALKIREKVCGLEHPDVATSLNNLALLYGSQDRYAEAEPLFLRALKINEKLLGPEHPALATCLNNLAYLYKEQSKYAEAESLYERALKMREKLFGSEHPDVAASLNNLALLYNSQGRYAEAEPLVVLALKINEKVLGPEHPKVATGFNNLAGLYDTQGKHAAAEPLYERALKMREKLLGPEHPDVATCLYNLADLYKEQGRYAEAEPLIVRALNIYEKALGPEHPVTSFIRQNYNDLLQRMQNEIEE